MNANETDGFAPLFDHQETLRSFLRKIFIKVGKDKTLKIIGVGPIIRIDTGDYQFRCYVQEYREKTNPNKVTPFGSSHDYVTLPFEFFTIIHPGLIIENGDVNFQRLCTEELKIRPFIPTVQLFRLQEIFNDSISLPGELGSTNVLLIDCQLNGGVKLIIPCSEIARFYYFSSTRLASCLLTPTALAYSDELHRLFYPSSLSSENATEKFIRIKKEMWVYDVPTIARIAYSSEARFEAGKIGRSFLSTSSVPVFLDCSFPFADITSIKCTGVSFSLNSGTRTLRAVLVDRILSCDHTFPFQKLRFYKERSASNGSELEGSHPTKSDNLSERGQAGGIAFNFDAYFLNEPEVSNQTAVAPNFNTYQVLGLPRIFPKLTDDIKRLTEWNGNGTNTSGKRRGRKEAQGLTTNKRTLTGSGHAPVGVASTSDNSQRVDRSLEDFMNELGAALEQRGCTYSSEMRGAVKKKFKPVEGNLNSFRYTDSGRLRSCLMLLMNQGDKHFVVLELEPRTSGVRHALRLIFFEDMREILANQVDLVIELLAAGHGLTAETYIVERVKHVVGEDGALLPEKTCNRILSRLLAN